MSPIAQSECHDAPWLIGQLVPSIATMIDDVVVAGKDAVREPVVADELPDVLGWVELRAFWRQRQDCDVCRYAEFGRQVPTCLVHQEHRVSAWRHLGGDFGHQQVHRRCVAARQDQSRRFALVRAYCTENICRCGALVLWRGWPAAALCPAPCDLVLLANSGFVLEPDFYIAGLHPLLARDLLQARGEVFLKASMAPSAWA